LISIFCLTPLLFGDETLARRPGTVVTDDNVMTFWPDCAFLFLFPFFFTIFDKTSTARLSGEKRPDLFFSFNPVWVYDDGRRYGFFFYHIKKMYECANKRERKTNGRKSSFT
jgi:hypothetical protein